jgi:hypothetical protein
MPYVFGRFVLRDSDGNYFCEICLRWFYSEGAILAHCRNTTSHEWCDKCKWVFETDHAKLEHFKISPSHNVCSMCTNRPDFTSAEELNDHYNGSHFLCGSCNVYYRTEDRLTQHVRYHAPRREPLTNKHLLSIADESPQREELGVPSLL